MSNVQAQIEALKENFQVDDLGENKVKIYLYVSKDVNVELEVDLGPVGSGQKPKFGFEKTIKDALGNINKTIPSLANWGPDSKIVDVIYELEDKLIEFSTSRFSVMDEIYTLVDNFGPRVTFEGKIAKVKLVDIRKNEYPITIDATEYPKLDVKFPTKLVEKLGDPEELRWIGKWGGHLFELIEELEYRLELYERLFFEFQIIEKFSDFVVKESLTFNPQTGYVAGDLENAGTKLEFDLDYESVYPAAMPRAKITLKPDNKALQAKVNAIISDAAEKWMNTNIFVRTMDEIAKAVFGKPMIRDLKLNKPIEGDTWECPQCHGKYLKASHDKSSEKFKCEYCYFGGLLRKQEKLITDLLDKFTG